MDYLDTIDLDKDVDKIYELMNDDTLNKKRIENNKLKKIRNDNHKKYYKINLIKFQNLPNDFDDIINQIKDNYKKIIPKEIFNQNYTEALETRKIINNIYSLINRVEKMIKTSLKEIEEENDKLQSELSIVNLKKLEIDEEFKKKAINLYNELVIYNSIMDKDIYVNFKQQLKRKEYIDKINSLISLGLEKKTNSDKKEITEKLNNELNQVIDDTSEKIQYLADLMVEDSEYTDSFNDFVSFYNKIIAYDDTNYSNVKQTLEILKDKDKFENYVDNFEKQLINEREKNLDEEKFIYNKIGIKNLKISLDYLGANYIELLDKPRKRVIEDSYERLESDNVDIDIVSNNIMTIIKYIWNRTLTGINSSDNYCMLCCKNDIHDEKIEGYLLSNKILARMDNYTDCQIGYICNYNNNILYSTENSDISNLKHEDLSKLKTPKQIEQEFINFGVINKLVLDGYKTKIIGVYYIDDDDKDKYSEATKLANDKKIPLIVIKKSNI